MISKIKSNKKQDTCNKKQDTQIHLSVLSRSISSCFDKCTWWWNIQPVEFRKALWFVIYASPLQCRVAITKSLTSHLWQEKDIISHYEYVSHWVPPKIPFSFSSDFLDFKVSCYVNNSHESFPQHQCSGPLLCGFAMEAKAQMGWLVSQVLRCPNAMEWPVRSKT